MCSSNCTLSYHILVPSGHNGVSCPYAEGDIKPCTGGDCVLPTDCNGQWSQCDAQACIENFTVITQNANGGAPCVHNDGYSRVCTDCFPPIDCVGGFGECSESCYKTFSISQQAQHNGAACMREDGFNQSCRGGRCRRGDVIVNEAKDCVGSFGTCTGDCWKRFSVTSPAENEGLACQHPDEFDVPCNYGECRPYIDCEGGWSECAGSPCERIFTIRVNAENGGDPCQHHDGEKQACPLGKCVGTTPIQPEPESGSVSPDRWTGASIVIVAAITLGSVFCVGALLLVYRNRTRWLFEIRKQVHKMGSREDIYASLAMTDQKDLYTSHLEDQLLGAVPSGDSFSNTSDMPSVEAASSRRASLLEGQYKAPQLRFAPMKKIKKTFGQTRASQ